MSEKKSSPTDLLHEYLGGQYVGGSLSELASYADLFRVMPEPIVIVDRHSGRILEANPTAISRIGKGLSILGEPIKCLIELDIVDIDSELEHQGSLSRVFKDLGLLGQHVEATFSRLKILGHVTLLQIILKDISDEIRLKDKVDRERFTDPLTQVYNRRFFEAWAEHTERGRLVGVAFFDIDHFKAINDREGHDVGDSALRRVAQELKAEFGGPDDDQTNPDKAGSLTGESQKYPARPKPAREQLSPINSAQVSREFRKHQFVFRNGGEEFIALIKDSENQYQSDVSRLERDIQTRVQNVMLKINQIQAEWAKRQPLGKLSVSVGIAVGEDQNTQELITQADRALYRAKQNGRNTAIIYSPDVSGLKGRSTLKKSA